MKRFIYLSLLITGVLFLGACDEDTDDILDQVDKAKIIGKWSVTKFEESKGTETPEVRTIEMNMFTVEFMEDGKFQYIDVDRADYEKGTYELPTGEMNIKITMPSEENSIDTIKVESLTATDAVLIMEDMDDGVKYTTKMTLKKNDGTEAKISADDFVGMWNVSTFNMAQYDYSDETKGDKLWERNVAEVPAKRTSFVVKTGATDFMFIDSYIFGMLDSGKMMILDESNIYLPPEDGSDDNGQILHIKSNESGKLTMLVIFYEDQEYDGTSKYVKYEQTLIMSKDDGTAFSMAEADLKMGWKFTETMVYKDNVLDPNSEEGPPAGATITFKDNGVAEMLTEGSQTPEAMKYMHLEGRYLILTMTHTETIDGKEVEREENEVILLDAFDSGTNTLTIKTGEYKEMDNTAKSTSYHEELVIKLQKVQ